MSIAWHPLAGLLVILGGFLATVVVAVLRGLASEEARGWLERLPKALIRLAVRRLPREIPRRIRDDQADEWAVVLHDVFHDTQLRPVTRLYRGVRHGLGVLRAAPGIGRELNVTESLGRLLVTFPKDPLDPADLSACTPLVPRARVLLEQAREHIVETPERADLLIAAARYLLRTGISPESALTLHREAAEVRKRLYRRGQLSVAEFADGYHNLAYNLHELGESHRAAGLDRQVLRIRRDLRADGGGEDVTEHLARSLSSLARDFRGCEDAAQARPLDEEALEIRRGLRRCGHLPDDRYIARSLSHLADDLRMLGDLQRARQLAEESLAMSENLFKTDHPERALSLDSLATIHRRLGNHAHADQCEAVARAMRERLHSWWR
jgi:tetratricopeptide (TPR) repeat protein